MAFVDAGIIGSAATDAQGIRLADRAEGQAFAQPDPARVSVWLEHGPTALARVFGLLCTLQLVPLTATARLAETNAIRLDLVFEPAARERLDLLLRKLGQLVECLRLEDSLTGA